MGGGVIETRYFNPLGDLKEICHFTTPSGITALNPYYGSVLVHDDRVYAIMKTGMSFQELKFPEALVYDAQNGTLIKRHSNSALIAIGDNHHIIWKAHDTNPNKSSIEIYNKEGSKVGKTVELPDRSIVTRARIEEDGIHAIVFRLKINTNDSRYHYSVLDKIDLATGNIVATAEGNVPNPQSIHWSRFIKNYLVMATDDTNMVYNFYSLDTAFSTGYISATKSLQRCIGVSFGFTQPPVQVGDYLYHVHKTYSYFNIDHYMEDRFPGAPSAWGRDGWKNIRDGEYVIDFNHYLAALNSRDITPLSSNAAYWRDNINYDSARIRNDLTALDTSPIASLYIDPIGKPYNGFSILPITVYHSGHFINDYLEIGVKDPDHLRIAGVLVDKNGHILDRIGLYDTWKTMTSRPANERFTRMRYPNYCFHHHKSRFVVMEGNTIRVFENPIFISGVNE